MEREVGGEQEGEDGERLGEREWKRERPANGLVGGVGGGGREVKMERGFWNANRGGVEPRENAKSVV